MQANEQYELRIHEIKLVVHRYNNFNLISDQKE